MSIQQKPTATEKVSPLESQDRGTGNCLSPDGAKKDEWLLDGLSCPLVAGLNDIDFGFAPGDPIIPS